MTKAPPKRGHGNVTTQDFAELKPSASLPSSQVISSQGLVLPFPAWRRRGWLDRNLDSDASARRLAESVERLPAFIAKMEGRR